MYLYQKLYSGNRSIRRIYDPRDSKILRLDLEHDHGGRRGKTGIPHQIPDAAQRGSSSETIEWRSTATRFSSSDAPPRTRVAYPGRTHGGSGSVAQTEHLGLPGEDYQEWKHYGDNHHALYR